MAHPAHVKVIANGRRWGKTFMAGTYALTCADYGAAVAWVVPTYKNSRPTWRFCEAACAPVWGRLKVNKTELTVAFPSGGWLGVYSADNDVSLRGEAFDLVIVDEAARISEQTYTDVILPTLADRDGRCLLISTPKGRNWFWQEWVKSKADGVHAAAFTAPTSANPMPGIQKAFALARERVSDRTFRQEWLAEFVADGGGVFRSVQEAATAQTLEAFAFGGQYVMGVDWGRQDDATVFCVLDVVSRSVAALDRMTRTDYGLQVGRLKTLAERFGVGQIVAEQNSMGGPLVEQLQREGWPVRGFVTTNVSKAHIIDALALAFERREIHILNDATLIGELLAYEATTLPGGSIRYGAPAGMHDDTVMALALAWSAVGQGDTGALAQAFNWQG